MKPTKTPWEYVKIPYEVTDGESYNGYDVKYDPPRRYTLHKIVSGKVVVVDTTVFTESAYNQKIEANYQLIVKAVNRFMEDSKE
jgi:hypothetical protein